MTTGNRTRGSRALGHYFRDEIVAQAKALALAGYSTRKAVIELQALFPGEATPSHATLVDWRKELSEADHGGLGDNGKREVVPWDEWEYPADFKAEAVAIVLATGNCAEAAREMAKRHPERYPSRILIWRWAKTIEPERFNALQRERNEQLYTKSLDIALSAGGKLEDEVDAGKITGKDLAITYGIASDKVVKIADLAQRSHDTQATRELAEAMDRLADLSVPQLHEVIEGEVIPDEPA